MIQIDYVYLECSFIVLDLFIYSIIFFNHDLCMHSHSFKHRYAANNILFLKNSLSINDNKVIILFCSIAPFDFPVLLLSNITDAWPALFLNTSHVFHTFQICWKIFSFLLCSFLANGESFVNVIHAFNFQIMSAVLAYSES